MIKTSCQPTNCSPQPTEPMPGTQLPCGGYADCPSGGGGGLTEVAVSDSESVVVQGNGTPGDPLFIEVKISEEPTNILRQEPDGLFVELPVFDAYFDIAASVIGEWGVDEIIFAHQLSENSVLPADWQFSTGIASGHVGSTSLSVELNGASISTLDLEDGVLVLPAFVQRVANRGDVLTLRALSAATFDYFALTLVASRAVRYASP